MKEPMISIFINEKAREMLSQCPEKTFIDLPVLDLDILAFRMDDKETHIYIKEKEHKDD